MVKWYRAYLEELRSATCHMANRITHGCLLSDTAASALPYPQPVWLLDSFTPEEWKAELTLVTNRPTSVNVDGGLASVPAFGVVSLFAGL